MGKRSAEDKDERRRRKDEKRARKEERRRAQQDETPAVNEKVNVPLGRDSWGADGDGCVVVGCGIDRVDAGGCVSHRTRRAASAV